MSDSRIIDGMSLLGSRDNRCDYCPNDIFFDLVNEIPKNEAEVKLKLKGEIQSHMILEKLLSYFASRSPHFGLYVSHVLSATRLIDKFAYSEGHFSVLYMKDEVVIIKRKTQKQRIFDKIMLCKEDRIYTKKGRSSLKLAIDTFCIPYHEIAYLGRLRREKQSLALVSYTTGRVYTLVLDATSIEVLNEEIHSTIEPLRQMELEYKGIDFSRSIPFESGGEDMHILHEICLEIVAIRKEIKKQLKSMNISVASTGQTKTKWLRKYGKALSKFG